MIGLGHDVPRRLAIGVTATFLVLSLGSWASYVQQFELAPARRLREDKQLEMREESHRKAALPGLQAETEALEARVRERRDAMPSGPGEGLGGVRQMLARLAEESGVELHAVRPEASPDPGAREPVHDVAVDVEARGRWSTLHRFLALIENEPRLVVAESVTLEAGESDGEAAAVPAKMALRIRWYDLR
jgi:Tfp pilus assembly protein PilO